MDDPGRWAQELKDPDINVRAAAAENLCHAGDACAPYALELVRACGDEEPVQNWAVAALEELRDPSPTLVGGLSELVADAHPLVAWWAATLLGRIGADAAGSQEALGQALSRSSAGSVRERAAWALARVGPVNNAAALESLSAAAGSAEPRLARLATSALETNSSQPT